MCTQKNKDLEKRKKKITLLDSNPHLLSAKDSLLQVHVSIRLSRNCIFFPFIKVIVPQSKAHFLRRFSKIGRKVIEYSYVSGQCRQTIHMFMSLSFQLRIEKHGLLTGILYRISIYTLKSCGVT